MDETGEGEVEVGSEIILKSENETTVDTALVKEETENVLEGCTLVENGNKYVTIVAQENDGQIFIYENNDEGVVQAKHTEEYIEVCDSDPSFEVNNDSQEKNIELADFKGDTQDANVEHQNTDITSDKNGNVSNCENETNNDARGEEQQEEDEEVQEVEEIEVDEENEEISVVNCSNNILNEKISKKQEENNFKNYKNVILEDWEVDVPRVEHPDAENFTEAVVVTEPPPEFPELNSQEVIKCDGCSVVEVSDEDSEKVVHIQSEQCSGIGDHKENSNAELEGEIMKVMAETKVDSLKYSKSITKNDIVKILGESTERKVKPIVTTGKDLFFSIELTKRLNEKLLKNKSLKDTEPLEKNNRPENDSFNNNNSVDDRQKIVDILEADEIKDWKSQPSKSDGEPKENGNDMEISNAIKNMEENTEQNTTKRPQKRTSIKKFKMMDKELEKSIALQQLREEFPTTRKRGRTMKKVNHIPFLASTVLEKAMTSPEVSTALKPDPPKRRPCYLPDNATDPKASETNDDDGITEDLPQTLTNKRKARGVDPNVSTPKTLNGSRVLDVDNADVTTVPGPVVKTYSVTRKSSDAENPIKSELETIAALTKALCESTSDTIQVKPKKQKTVSMRDYKMKKKITEKETKSKLTSGGKRNLELEKLLGDEGAVRMLYDTQHKETNSQTPKKSKTTTGLRKDLALKTKLVRNAVMKLSGVGVEGVHLRGKRLSKTSESMESKSEPLFTSTPNVVLYKPKKKQRAEASRILYRHSSSESFDSSEGYRRMSFDADVDGPAPASREGPVFNSDRAMESNSAVADVERVPLKARIKKSDVFKRKEQERLHAARGLPRKVDGVTVKGRRKRPSADFLSTPGGSKLDLSNVPVRKSSRPRMVSKKYSIWSSTSMDCLSVESLGLKKLKKASPEMGKKLNCKELTILQYESLVQVILNPVSTLLKNSLSLEVLEELNEVFNFLSEETSCRAVLLSATGSTFCQGVDINQIISFEDNERKTRVDNLTKAIGDFCTCLSAFKKPIIAGVHAAAIGLGVTVLAYCDLVVASDTATFYTPYVRLGQAPEGAPTYTFPRISRHLVSDLLIQSQKMTAEDAFKHGLVTRIIPEERFQEELLMLARHMAAQPTQGMQSIKSLLRNREGIVDTLEAEGKLLGEHWTTPDCLGNMIKFLNSGELQLRQVEHT